MIAIERIAAYCYNIRNELYYWPYLVDGHISRSVTAEMLMPITTLTQVSVSMSIDYEMKLQKHDYA